MLAANNDSGDSYDEKDGQCCGDCHNNLNCWYVGVGCSDQISWC